MGGDTGFATAALSGAWRSGSSSLSGVRAAFSSGSSTNTSVGSSPVPFEQDMGHILQQTAALLALSGQSDCASVPGAVSNNAAQLAGCNAPSFLTPRQANFRQSFSSGNSLASSTLFKKAPPLPANRKPSRTLPPPAGRKSPKPDSYKTVMCQAWLETGKCNFGENCRFAHGEEELRPCKIQTKNPKYKTKLCDKYTMTGLCPYGNRCLFIHPDAAGRNAYIRPDRLAKMERERTVMASAEIGGGGGGGSSATATILSSSSSSERGVAIVQTPLTSRVAARPPPSWPLESPNFFSSVRDSGVKTRCDTAVNFPTSRLFCENCCGIAKTFSTPSSSSGIGVSPEMPERLFALGDITNRDVTTGPVGPTTSTPAAAVELSGGSGAAAATISDESPDSGAECDSSGWSTMESDPFHLALANDNLARHLATVFSSDL